MLTDNPNARDRGDFLLSYKIDFACDDRDPLQLTLNELYDYRDDIPTKVLHRCRLNLLSLLLRDLATRGEIHSFESAIAIGCSAGVYCRILSGCGCRSVPGAGRHGARPRWAQPTSESPVPALAPRDVSVSSAQPHQLSPVAAVAARVWSAALLRGRAAGIGR